MENLKSYLDGELDIAQQAEVETHLRNDEELQKMVEEFSAISSTLKTVDTGEPYGFEKLEERLNSAPKVAAEDKKKIWRLAGYWSASMACLALASLFMFPVFAQSKLAAKKSANMSASAMSLSDESIGGKASPSSDNAKSAAPEWQDRARTARGLSGVEGESRDASATPAPPGVATGKDGDVFGSISPTGEDKALNGSDTKPADSGAAQTQMETDLLNGHMAEEPVSSEGVVNGAGGFGGGSAGKDVKEELRPRRLQSSNSQVPKLAQSDQNGRVPASESQFKSEMRAKRDGVTQPIPGIPETDHGIFLERKGEMQVKVEDLKRAVNETTGMIASLDGFVTSSNTQNQADGGEALMTLRVPTKNFTTAIDKLEGMGELISENTGSQDITTETVNNSARMISWADEEDRLIKELAKAKNDNQRYRLKQLIGQARANLEAHKAQVNSLLERAKYSTINLSLVRGDRAAKVGGGSSNWSGDALKGAKDNLGSIGQVLGTIGIYFLVFAPIWLPFAIAAYIIRKKNS